jgi:lipid-binding SYLF domain-containing protein
MRTITRCSLVVAIISGAVGVAACGSSSSSSSTETTAAKVEPARAETIDRLEQSTQIISDMSGKIPPEVASNTKCVIVFPSIVKAGLIVGGQGGKGFGTCQNARGWSAPAPLSIGGGTLGAQVGGSSNELIALVKSEKGMKALESGNFRVGVDASATAGPVGTGRGGSTGITEGGDLVSYSHAKGLYAGANLDGTTIKLDEDSTKALYGSKHDVKELLSGNVPPPKEPASQRFLGAIERGYGSGHSKVSLLE